MTPRRSKRKSSSRSRKAVASDKQCKGCTHEGVNTCVDCGALICEAHTVHKKGQRDVLICFGCLFGWTQFQPKAVGGEYAP